MGILPGLSSSRAAQVIGRRRNIKCNPCHASGPNCRAIPVHIFVAGWIARGSWRNKPNSLVDAICEQMGAFGVTPPSCSRCRCLGRFETHSLITRDVKWRFQIVPVSESRGFRNYRLRACVWVDPQVVGPGTIAAYQSCGRPAFAMLRTRRQEAVNQTETPRPNFGSSFGS